MKRIVFVTLCVFLAGCSHTVPVSGKIDKVNERFAGTATANIFGQGSLIITTDEGVTCRSNFDVPTAGTPDEGVTSQGTLNCSDGRTGHFVYSGTAGQGNGFGKLSDGHKFTFTYGAMSNVQVQGL